ncbi:MAG: DUF6580 family putative transport protein [Deltaproteobacteria bacterium]
MLALILMIFGVLFRIIPHAPNFTPTAALALFGAAFLPNRRQALIMPLALIMISDLFIGLHDMVVFTWGSVFLISLTGLGLRRASGTTRVLLGSFAGSVIFYLVTNFGVWAAGWYPLTPQGLFQCYVAGIPFFRNFFAGTLVYAAALFVTYALAARAVRRTAFAKALLTS